ncbi:MAG: tetratricopeptide repeat protein, partial [Deltaproteobacteria bacterium]|nr:tetratricopeptide repeat protein [Deltaproteobacteria bacterium]
MEAASAESVLGDFDGTGFQHFDESYRFGREDDVFRIELDGEPHDVAYTFGATPLQQYLVPAPGGRFQAVGVAWDARPAGEGGQRWFHLNPDEAVPRGDVLHWSGVAGRWNTQCADCHSTNLTRGYQPETNTYDTTWSEPDVACEACHGPASLHVAWADRGDSGEGGDPGLAVQLSGDSNWHFVEGEPIARRTGTAARAELSTCAPCHSRRSSLVAAPEPGRPFLDGYRPALLDAGLYHADGQILDEVYVWGSFVQSRMHAAGVACSDCHDPHALAIEEPDAVCSGCHRSEVFAVREHHGHETGSAGASCVACHMPTRTYMGVDDRRDHGFRIPRPDLSQSVGVPNACGGCHVEQTAGWAASAIEGWRGGPVDRGAHFAITLDAGRRRLPGAGPALAALAENQAQPAIVRATALSLLGAQLDRSTAPVVLQNLAAEEGLVRMAAVGAAEALPPDERFRAVAPRLADPRLAVRIEAARVAMSVPPAERRPAPALVPALAEYRAAQDAHADRPEAHVNLGNLEVQLGDPDAARLAYERAIALGPYFIPAYVNLAELHRSLGRDDRGEAALRAGLEQAPASADLHHALGLLLARAKNLPVALEHLARAHAEAPGNARYAYVHGVALLSSGETAEAVAAFEAAHAAHPGDADILAALANVEAERG